MARPAPRANQEIIEVPVVIAGGNRFGRYTKISDSQTWNMLVSDTGLVDYSGYKNLLPLLPDSPGRGIYSSARGNFMIAILGANAYRINYISTDILEAVFIGELTTTSGDVFISENNNAQICITDESHLYVYNYQTPTSPLLLTSGINFPTGGDYSAFPILSPGYVSFQNGRIIIADLDTNLWYLSGINDALMWNTSSAVPNHAYVGSLQTKPDTMQAVVPLPGGGNNIMVFGRTVIEQWQDVGAALFPYQRSSSLNIDYGCLNASSIAALDNYIVWLAANEQGGPTIMVTNGGREEAISTDGIDFKLANITDPTNCTGFLFRQDGHLIYQFTFPTNNISFIYDFNTKLFFTVSDENENYHIARNVVFFHNDYYFVSLKGGNIYRMGTQYTTYDYGSDNVQQIPRIRITEPFRLPTQRMFIMKSFGFTMENGQQNYYQTYTTERHEADSTVKAISTESNIMICTESGKAIATEGSGFDETFTYVLSPANVDLSVSRDGGASFGNSWRLNMNQTGNRKSRMIWQRLGQANDVTLQIRFNGPIRFVAFDGLLTLYQ